MHPGLGEGLLHGVFGLIDVTVEHVDGIPEHGCGVAVEDLGEREAVTERGVPGQVLVVEVAYRFRMVRPFPAVHRRSLPFRSPANAADDQVLIRPEGDHGGNILTAPGGVHAVGCAVARGHAAALTRGS